MKKLAEALGVETYELLDESVDKRPDGEIIDDIFATHLIAHFNKLNFNGKEKAVEQVKMLTEIPKYQKDNE